MYIDPGNRESDQRSLAHGTYRLRKGITMRQTLLSVVLAACLSGVAGCGNGKPAGGDPPAQPKENPVTVDPRVKPRPPLTLAVPPVPSRSLGGKDLTALPAASLRGLARTAVRRSNFKDAVRYQYWALMKDGAGQYDLACYYSQHGAVDAAFYWLQRAGLEEGVDLGWAGEDTDLVSVRRDPRWNQLADFLRQCNAYWAHSGHRKTVLILPKEYTRGTPIPVLVGLHGMGDNPENFVGKEYQEYADQLDVAFVGVSGTLPRGPKSFVWSPDHAKNAERIDAALKEVSNQLTVKEGQVVAFGFSQGAQAAAEVAARNPDKYAGAIIMSPGGLGIPEAAVFKAHAKARRQGFVAVCGAGEAPGNVALTAEYARLLKAMGARVRHKPYPGMNQHAFPPDYHDVLPDWIRFILDPKQS
jgi:predicted esterase